MEEDVKNEQYSIIDENLQLPDRPLRPVFDEPE
jgi:hypothetical protein